jgi:hypothetical protein
MLFAATAGFCDVGDVGDIIVSIEICGQADKRTWY